MHHSLFCSTAQAGQVAQPFVTTSVLRHIPGAGFSVQLLSRIQLFATPWTAARQASLSITNPRVCSNSCPSSQ